jgi:septum formation protein
VPPLVLASTSPYRAQQLRRLGLAFAQVAPGIDESRMAGEAADAVALRLALEKARAVAARRAGALVIGSDQVALCDGAMLGKPGTAEAARDQLARSSGRTVEFLTAVALVDAKSGMERTALDRTFVRFRVLDAGSIARYVERESPLDCAGSFKSEGLGVVLFESIETRDPDALVGLPLIALCGMLRDAGLDPLA